MDTDPAPARDLTVPDLIRLAGTHSELTIPLKEYFEALRAGDQELRLADARFAAERDRRYSELSVEREKALKIKETADERALKLQAETQQYKDEKANELREQISRERGVYVTRDQLEGSIREIKATIQPLVEYTQSDAGRNLGVQGVRTDQLSAVNNRIAAIAVIFIGLEIVTTLVLYFALHH